MRHVDFARCGVQGIKAWRVGGIIAWQMRHKKRRKGGSQPSLWSIGRSFSVAALGRMVLPVSIISLPSTSSITPPSWRRGTESSMAGRGIAVGRCSLALREAGVSSSLCRGGRVGSVGVSHGHTTLLLLALYLSNGKFIDIKLECGNNDISLLVY